MAAYIYNSMEGAMNRFLDILPNTIQQRWRTIDAGQAKRYLQAAALALIARSVLNSTYLCDTVSYPIATASIVLILESHCHKVIPPLNQKTTDSCSSTLFKGGLAAFALRELTIKIGSLNDPLEAVSLVALTTFFTAFALNNKRDETNVKTDHDPRNFQKDFLLIETLHREIKVLERKLRFFDRFVMSHPQLLQFVLEHICKHPGVLRTRKHPSLPADLPESDRLAIKKSRIEFDLESRFLYLQQFPELKAEFEKAINISKHLLKEF